MTEAEWLTRDDAEAFFSSRPHIPRTARKRACLAVAYCRILGPLLAKDELLRRGLEALEAELDSEEQENDPESEELWWKISVAKRHQDAGAPRFRQAAAQVLLYWKDPEWRDPELVAATLLDCFQVWGASVGLPAQIAYARREVVGNPFRPVAFSPQWRTDTAVTLARQMYEGREFSAMPILADALQEVPSARREGFAGCDSADVLDHCRGPGPHVRGCWVVDLVLGKA
jgi:hypothetical protein